MQESTVFKPEYKDTHWFQFLAPLVMYIFAAVIYLMKQDLVSEYAADFSIPLHEYDAQILILFMLFGFAVLLGMISFLANHIRKIELNSEGIVFHRLCGKRLVAEYKSMKWNDSVLILNKQHNLDISGIFNREAMKEFMQEYMDMTPEELADNPIGNKRSILNILKMVFMTVISVVIMGSGAALMYHWAFVPGNTAFWLIDGGIAIVLCLELFSKGRNLLF